MRSAGVGVGGAWNTADAIIVGIRAAAWRGASARRPRDAATALGPSPKDAAHLFPVFLPTTVIFCICVSRSILRRRFCRSEISRRRADRQSRSDWSKPCSAALRPGLVGDGHVVVLYGTLMVVPFVPNAGSPSVSLRRLGVRCWLFRDGAFFFAAGNALVDRRPFAISTHMAHRRVRRRADGERQSWQARRCRRRTRPASPSGVQRAGSLFSTSRGR